MKNNSNFARANILFLTLLFANKMVFAAPENGHLIEGEASIEQNGDSTVITQQSDEALIEWDSFDVEQAQNVQFIQPDSQSITINNILDSKASFIHGDITANGQVVLINNHGFVFTGGSFVQADSLTLAAADLMQDSQGNWLLQSTGENAQIINAGTIEVQNGHLMLLANQIVNTGDMTSHFGDVKLIADQGGFYGLDPKGLTYLALPEEIVNTQATSIDQSGKVSANAGNVSAQVISRNDAIDAMLAHSGQTYAGATQSDEGEYISFDASDIVISGDVSADNISIQSDHSLVIDQANIGDQSSSIELNAKSIDISNSQLDATHSDDGGSINIGGMHLSTEQQAQSVTVDENTTFDVSSIDTGNGGESIVWSTNGTKFKGEVLATGGAQSGDGGFVEVSAKQNLQYDGLVDTTAQNGQWGMLLLDPDHIIIADGSGGANDADVADGDIALNDGTGQTWTISEQALEAASATSNVTLYSTQSITINDLSDDTLSLAQTGTVIFQVNNQDNTVNNGSASIVMEDKNDTLEFTGNGDVRIYAYGRTNENGSVTVDLGNIVKTGTGNIEIRTNQVDNALDDDVGSIDVSVGDITSTDGFTFSADNSLANVSSKGVSIETGDINIADGLVLHLNSTNEILVDLQQVDITAASGDGIQALLDSTSNEGVLLLNNDVTISGSNFNANFDELRIGGDITIDTKGGNATSGDINLAGVTVVEGQNNNIEFYTGTLSNLNFDFSTFQNVENLQITSDLDLNIGDGFVGGALNFDLASYGFLEAASNMSTFSTVGNISSNNLDISKDLTLIADSDQTGDALTLTNFSATNADLGLTVNAATDLTNLDLGTGGLNLIAQDENDSIGFGGGLTTDIQFSDTQVNSWTLSSVTSTNASGYEFNNLNTTFDFSVGDGTQHVQFVGVSNTFGSINVLADTSNVNAQLITTTGDVIIDSTNNLNITQNITSANNIDINSDINIGLGTVLELTAENSMNIEYMFSNNTTSLTLNAGGDSTIGGMGIAGGDLIINFDADSNAANVLNLNWNIGAKDITINTNGLGNVANDDRINIKGTIASDSLAITNFQTIDLRNDLTITDPLALTSDLLVTADATIQSQSITLEDITTTNDSSLILQSLEDVNLASVDLAAGDLTINIDDDALSTSSINITGTVDAENLIIEGQATAGGAFDDVINFDDSLTVNNLTVSGFNNINSEKNITASGDINITNAQLRLSSAIEVNGSEVNLDTVLSNNDSNLTINASEVVSANAIDLGNGDLAIELDQGALNTGSINLNGELNIRDLDIQAQSITTSALNDSIAINAITNARDVTIEGFDIIDLNNELVLSGNLTLTGNEAQISNDITALDFVYYSENASDIQITGDSILSIESYTNNVGIEGSSDLTMNLLNASGTVNIDNIILSNSDLTINMNNALNVNVDQLGAQNITLTNNATADLEVGNIVDNSNLIADNFMSVTFTEDILIASLDVDTSIDIIQTDGTKIEATTGIIDLNAGGDIDITQIESANTNPNTVILNAGGSIVDVNNTQQDFIVDNADVLSLNATGALPDFDYSYDDNVVVPDPDPVVPDPVEPEPVVPEVSVPVDDLQGQVEDVLNQPTKDSDQTEEAVEETNEVRVSKQAKSLDAQFEQCEDDDKNCEKQQAVKSFLGRLLIGGELPGQ